MGSIKSFPNNRDEYVGAEYAMRWLHGRTSGVFAANNNAAVAAAQNSMAVTVSDGLGWITDSDANGVVWWNDTEKTTGAKMQLTIDAADGVLNRIDRVIVEWKTTDYADLPEIKILKGTAASTAAAPALTNNTTVRQISLAKISIAAGTTAITASMITDERLDTSVCGLVTESVTADTSVINAQFAALLAQLQTAIEQAISGEIPDGSITTSKYADGSITAAKVADKTITGMQLADKTVTAAKLAADAVKLTFTNVSIAASQWATDSTYTDFPYRALVGLSDAVTANMIPEVVFNAADAVSGIFAPVAQSTGGGIMLYASEVPSATVTIPIIIMWR